MSKLSDTGEYKSRGYVPYALWPEEKKDAARARARKYRAKDPQKARDSTKRWRLNNLELVKSNKYKWLDDPINRVKHSLYAAKRRAKAKGLEFSVSIDDIMPLPEKCPVLGIQLNYYGAKRSNGVGGGFIDDSPTVDRIDSTKGYVSGNVRVISWRANRLKSDANIEELRAILRYMENEQCRAC